MRTSARAIEAFLETVDELDDGQVLALSAHSASDGEERLDFARAVARRIAARRGVADELEDLRSQVVTWAGRRVAPRELKPGGTVRLVGTTFSAAHAVFDAATVVLLGSWLDPETRTILGARFQAVTGMTLARR